ncbi:SusC/RagA family TonB-linked outer membrane protein [Dysgonomonas sp. GY617]|nr:SusC/RagA family TonB-linked outer membrane protein [Dysgonomonas sp. GY617]
MHKFQLSYLHLGKSFQRTAFATLALSVCCSSNLLFASSTAPVNSYEGSLIVVEQQQAKTIQGLIVDKTGEPLSGVTITVKGSTSGTISDLDGKYSINIPDQNAILVFSYLGFRTQEVAVAGKTTVNVTLNEDSQVLGEVVVTALGIKRQARSIGYSTTQVSGSDFTESRDINLGNALTGKVAGVSVSNNATGPGGSSRVVIRGNASLTGNNQPLYVIDGIPFDNSTQGNSGTWGGAEMGDGLSNINADDIADIQVLKGAAASALYGYRGGNGAILITTKSGSKAVDGIGIEVNNNLTFNSIYDHREFQKVYGQGTQNNRPMSQTAAIESYSSSWGEKMDGGKAINFLGNEYAYNPVDNWKKFYNTGITNQTSVALSGKGGDKIVYRIGFSNITDQSIIPNSGLRQQGINMNTTYNITPKLHLNVTANYIFEKVRNRANLSDGNANVNATLLYLANSYDVRWLKPAVDTDRSELLPGNNVYFNNPYFLTHERSNSTRRNRLTTGATLKYDITDWLYAQGQVTRDGYIMDYQLIIPTGSGADPGGKIEEWERNYYELNGNYLLGFNKKVGESFSINATFGGNTQRTVNKSFGTDGSIGPFIIPFFYSANNVANRPYTQTYSEYRVNSVYGTADFGFKDYLFLNFTGRNDWFSTLNPNNNHYFYPSVSTSFMFSEAFKLPDWVYSGKIRASYAEASNGTIPYQNYLTYSLETFKIQGQSVGKVTNRNIPNADLRPVKIQEWEAGLNVQFLNNRLGFDMAVYKKKTTDDITTVSTSYTSGYYGAVMNIGEIQNKGIEAMVHAVPVRTKDFMWNTSFNIAYNNSEIKYLGGVKSLSIDGAQARNGTAVVMNIVGDPYGQIVGYKYKTNENGDRIYDKDGYAVRSDNQEVLGNGIFKVTGGFRNEFSYKDFSMAFLLDYKFGAKIFSGTNLNLYSAGLQKETLGGREGGYVGKGVVNTGTTSNPVWTPNTKAVDAQLYWRRISSESPIDEEFVYDASFIKLRELSIAYRVPQSMIRGSFVKALSLSLVGRNIWTLLKHTPNIDPESAYNNTNGQGLELNGYPPTRSIGFNVNVKF